MTEHAESAADDLPQPSGAGRVDVVGTAHVSEHSVAEVESAIEEADPDVVAVELDEGRYRQIKGETPDDLDASDLLRGNTVFQFLAYWMLSYIQTRLGERFDIQPGADMKAGIDTAERLGLGVALVDRDIQTTVQRFWARRSRSGSRSARCSAERSLSSPARSPDRLSSPAAHSRACCRAASGPPLPVCSTRC